MLLFSASVQVWNISWWLSVFGTKAFGIFSVVLKGRICARCSNQVSMTARMMLRFFSLSIRRSVVLAGDGGSPFNLSRTFRLSNKKSPSVI